MCAMPGQSQIDKAQGDDERKGQRRCENDRIDSRQRLCAKHGGMRWDDLTRDNRTCPS